jgi:hypothetical protein
MPSASLVDGLLADLSLLFADVTEAASAASDWSASFCSVFSPQTLSLSLPSFNVQRKKSYRPPQLLKCKTQKRKKM